MLQVNPSVEQDQTCWGREQTCRHSKGCVFKATQIKTTIRHHLTPVKTATIRKSTHNICCRGCGKNGNLLALLWGCKLV